MRHHRLWTFALALLALAAAACIAAKALPGTDLLADEHAGLPAPSPAATATPHFPVELRDQSIGVSMRLPEGWEYGLSFGLLVASDDPQMLDEGTNLDALPAPAIVGLFGAPEDLNVSEDVDSIEQMTDELLDNMVFAEDDQLTLGQPESMTVGGYPATVTRISGYSLDFGTEIEGRIVAVLTDYQAGVLLGLAPQDQWDGFVPTFEDILETVAFFAPSPDAAVQGQPPQSQEPSSIKTIEAGDSLSSTLPDGGVDLYLFQASAGQTITLTVTPQDENFDPTLTLLDTGLDEMAEVDDGFSGEEETLTVTLPDSGFYRLDVTSFGFTGGSYTIALTAQ